MLNIAILGFGVVGSGVADLITKNNKEVCALGEDEINIKYILDLRDFPDSPFADRVVHDFSIIENDSEVGCVIECMGGVHPAYDYTAAALCKGKHVITSNKAVVAASGDELLKLAAKNNVCYRFEAAVGGGIPVIAPMISFMTHNKIGEVRGILNGTTNYILTKMFSFGESFESSLLDAQEKGYAERDPYDDVMGVDACRKIAILSALTDTRLYPTDKIHTEGITGIRAEDVKIAERLGMKIKLLGRSIRSEGGCYVLVAPFMIRAEEPLASVSGVYNAIEVIGSPIGNVMFYGQGAGGGATASAIVGDLMLVMKGGTDLKAPVMISAAAPLPFDSFRSRSYVATDATDEDVIVSIFGRVQFVESDGGLCFLTGEMCEAECAQRLSTLEEQKVAIKSRIRLL